MGLRSKQRAKADAEVYHGSVKGSFDNKNDKRIIEK